MMGPLDVIIFEPCKEKPKINAWLRGTGDRKCERLKSSRCTSPLK